MQPSHPPISRYQFSLFLYNTVFKFLFLALVYLLLASPGLAAAFSAEVLTQ